MRPLLILFVVLVASDSARAENDKLSASRYIKKSQETVDQAFAYFTDRPVIKIKAYGDVFIKLPLLDLN